VALMEHDEAAVIRISGSTAGAMVQGYLHRTDCKPREALVLAHGASSDANSRLLVAMAEAFAKAGVTVLRIDLPFRQGRKGPPHPSIAAKDREGIREASRWLREHIDAPVSIGGHSYGGRQSSMLAAEDPGIASKLLLMSYPLHPPGKPEQLRIAHFPALRTPALFVHGTRDPFGSPDEMRREVPASAELLFIEGAAHELKPLLKNASAVVERFAQMSAT
jgi:predicted alpha/beta-hydrolase family hydrolase